MAAVPDVKETPMPDPRTILTLAATELETHGWKQGTYGHIDGCKCTWGALFTAAYRALDYPLAEAPRTVEISEEWLPEQVVRAAVQAGRLLADHLGYGGLSATTDLVPWNDDPQQDELSVIEALRAAAGVEAVA